ncbi:hypothetical protein [Sulfuricurvum sp.]|uniref:hypothetical protein n=1 Tax=Sulfuricurvum sp. TaxID=2025608 RepID=UPI00261D1CCA|nr:hypothetical protein [Sulfuricurvum sp.]MDD3597407.1 hypothetical protein [Sulfuricurvum sp.]
MNFTKIIDRLKNPTLDISSFPLTENSEWTLHQMTANDGTNEYLLYTWLTVQNEEKSIDYKTDSLTQMNKIKAGLRMYTNGGMKLGYATDYFEPTEREINEKKYKSIRCVFLSEEPEKNVKNNVYLYDLDVHAMLENWNLAMQGRKTIYLMEAMSILSVYDSPNKIQSYHYTDALIESYGKSYEALMSLSAPEHVKELLQKRAFKQNAGRSILNEYQKRHQNDDKK